MFSFSGRHIAASLSDPAKAGNFNRTLENEEEHRRFVRDYETEGFAYCDYPDWPGYGTSLAKASWVMKKIEDRDLQLELLRGPLGRDGRARSGAHADRGAADAWLPHAARRNL